MEAQANNLKRELKETDCIIWACCFLLFFQIYESHCLYLVTAHKSVSCEPWRVTPRNLRRRDWVVLKEFTERVRRKKNDEKQPLNRTEGKTERKRVVYGGGIKETEYSRFIHWFFLYCLVSGAMMRNRWCISDGASRDETSQLSIGLDNTLFFLFSAKIRKRKKKDACF